MTWWMWAIYGLGAVFAARSVNIRLSRKWAKVQKKRWGCSLCSENEPGSWRYRRIKPGYGYVCSNHSYLGSPRWRWLTLPPTALLWPIWVPVTAGLFVILGVSLGVGWVGKQTRRGVVRTASAAATIPPVAAIRRVNRWFWEDPQARRNRKTTKLVG